jgi:hypothetical protein
VVERLRTTSLGRSQNVSSYHHHSRKEVIEKKEDDVEKKNKAKHKLHYNYDYQKLT